jgi:hypothetical protein
VNVTEDEEEKEVEGQNSKAASTATKANETVVSRRQSLSSNLIVTGVLKSQICLSDVF